MYFKKYLKTDKVVSHLVFFKMKTNKFINTYTNLWSAFQEPEGSIWQISAFFHGFNGYNFSCYNNYNYFYLYCSSNFCHSFRYFWGFIAELENLLALPPEYMKKVIQNYFQTNLKKTHQTIWINTPYLRVPIAEQRLKITASSLWFHAEKSGGQSYPEELSSIKKPGYFLSKCRIKMEAILTQQGQCSQEQWKAQCWLYLSPCKI